jgi:asparagine synthase (glutamine-hydrolysing)
VQNDSLGTLAREALAGLRNRGIVRATFLDDLIGSRVREHPGYYGEMVWILVMLELWLRHHAADFQPIALSRSER